MQAFHSARVPALRFPRAGSRCANHLGSNADGIAAAEGEATGLTHAGAGGPPPNPLYEQASFEPELDAGLELAGGRGELDVSSGYEIVNDRYEGYYAAGGNHPPLEYGDRRVDRRFSTGLDVRDPLTAHWAIIGEADALIRRTNFPNYVPNVFPASRQYDIEWSYENYLVQAGVEYRP